MDTTVRQFWHQLGLISLPIADLSSLCDSFADWHWSLYVCVQAETLRILQLTRLP